MKLSSLKWWEMKIHLIILRVYEYKLPCGKESCLCTHEWPQWVHIATYSCLAEIKQSMSHKAHNYKGTQVRFCVRFRNNRSIKVKDSGALSVPWNGVENSITIFLSFIQISRSSGNIDLNFLELLFCSNRWKTRFRISEPLILQSENFSSI